jgi:hypothetical protein
MGVWKWQKLHEIMVATGLQQFTLSTLANNKQINAYVRQNMYRQRKEITMVSVPAIKDALADKTSLSEDGGHGSTIIIPTPEGGIHLRPRAVLPKREPDPHPTAHWVLFLFDLVDILLFLFDFGVLGHVLDGSEVVIVTCVNFGVEGGDEWCANGAEVIPFYAGEEGVVGYLVEG